MTGRKLVLASNNAGKLVELQAMFAPLGVELIRQGELDIPAVRAPDGVCDGVDNWLALCVTNAVRVTLGVTASDALCVWVPVTVIVEVRVPVDVHT